MSPSSFDVPPLRHDNAYRRIFGDPHMMAELIRGFASPEITEGWDLTTLEKVDTQWTTLGRAQRRSDLLWRIRRGSGGWVFVYVLLELQSTQDANMVVRVNSYVALCLQSLLNAPEASPTDPLPFILPIVLYSGTRRWRAGTSLRARQREFSKTMRRYSPSLEFLLIDENVLEPERLSGLANACAVFFRMKRLEDPLALVTLVDELDRLLPEERHTGLRLALVDWLYDDYLPSHRLNIGDESKRTASLSEVKIMLAEGTPDWFAHERNKGRLEGRDEGRIEGRLEGEARVLKRQLARRFGPSLPAWVDQRLQGADEVELERLADAVLNAGSLEAVFAEQR